MDNAWPRPLPSTVGEFKTRCYEMAVVLDQIDDVREVDVNPLLACIQQTHNQIVEEAGVCPEYIPDMTELSITVVEFLATNEVLYRQIIDRYAN